ncbi:hypothetical protein AAG747_25790 [Rapidithrix thailandica]|uniref:HNH endonuclease n=1 Tax=Rapidithrix thailandica TaxID=413964 RepID=A0AAW9S2E7_9BACT
MFKYDKNKKKQLFRDIATQFYEKLNPQKKNKAYHKHSIIHRLDQRIQNGGNASNKNYFYQKLSKSNYELLRSIIIGSPQKLKTIKEEIEADQNIPAFFSGTNGNLKSTPFGEEVLEMFGYNNFRKSEKSRWLVENLDIPVCPYCNYEPLLIVPPKTLCDFDHFIPKVMAPYLSMSFYNLIPSCTICNQRYKGDKLAYIHPYSQSLDSIVEFSIKPDRVDFSSETFNIILSYRTGVEPSQVKNAQENLNLFKIVGRYNCELFIKEVKRLDSVQKAYPESRKMELLDEKLIGKIIIKDKCDLLRVIAETSSIPFNEDEAKREEKGKFKMDLAKDYFKIIV